MREKVKERAKVKVKVRVRARVRARVVVYLNDYEKMIEMMYMTNSLILSLIRILTPLSLLELLVKLV